MGTAVLMYAQDFDEFYPRTLQTMDTAADPGPGDVNKRFSNAWWWGQLLYPYDRSFQVTLCPSGVRQYDGNVFSGHYGTNTGVMSMTNVNPVRSSEIQSASKVFLIMDSGVYNASPGLAVQPLVPNTPTIGSNQYIPGTGEGGATTCAASTIPGQQNDCQSGRHFGGLNVGYADGHVKWTKTSEVYLEAKKTYIPTACSATPLTCTQVANGAWNKYNN